MTTPAATATTATATGAPATTAAVVAGTRPKWHRHTAPGHAPVLDIGGEVGALIVYLAGDTPSGELDIEPTGRPEGRFHTGVHHRHMGADHTWVAVFPEVAEGAYDLLHDDGSPMASVAIAGGRVEQLDLR